MPSVYRVTANWSGFVGAPGYSRFHFELLNDSAALDAAVSEVRTFFNAMAGYMLTTWTVNVSQLVETYDQTTGTLLAEQTAPTTPAPVLGTVATSSYTGGAGAIATWTTNGIWRGHRIKGRTFMVPLVGVAATDGTLTPAVITALSNAGNVLCAASAANFGIWSKVFSAPPGSTQIDGHFESATSCIVNDKSGLLRSRRD